MAQEMKLTAEQEAQIEKKIKEKEEQQRQTTIDRLAMSRFLDAQRNQPGHRYF